MTFIPGLSRAVPVAAAALGCALLAGPALAKNNPPATPAPGAAANAVITVDAVRDSVTIGGLAAGPATVEVLRSGVVIGVYSDNVEASRPLTVNTVEPTATKPSGDCWERGVLPVSAHSISSSTARSIALRPSWVPGKTRRTHTGRRPDRSTRHHSG